MSCNTTISALPRVGYWWSEKKSRKFNVQTFIQVCRGSGLELVKIDLDCPLETQGPFVAIVHKLTDTVLKADKGDPQSKAICDAFQDYADRHPEVIIIDPLPNVRRLLDRYRQYKSVEDSELQEQGGVFIPAFVELTTSNVSENIAKMKAAGVTYPCVCKPSLAHGSTLAHQMNLIFNDQGLKDITPPCVAQKFINHNAILYKLFIIGDKYFMIERPSLKNFSAGDQKTIFFHSHDISKPHSASALTELDESEHNSPLVRPEKERMDHIVQVLCQRLGLTLFGIDVIIDNKTGRYAIIDMNIFPGYDEVDNFFQILCDLIISRISLPSKDIANIVCEPSLENCCLSSSVKVQPIGKKFTFDDEQSMAVIPYFHRCFCCPISGLCSNELTDVKHFPSTNQNHLSLSTELSTLLQDVRTMKQKEVFSYSETTDAFKSPDSAQDDSGIETSDSCDEKKKETGVRTVKRQHSRNYVTSTIITDGSG